MTLDARSVAQALGGNVTGRGAVVPGPGHSRKDRSLSIKVDPAARDGFIVHSFAGDDPILCRDYVRAALGLGGWEGRHRQSSGRLSRPCTIVPGDESASRSLLALRIWNEARDPCGTIVATYLASRGLTLPQDVAGEVIRFHPRLKFEGASVGAMVTLFRDIRTDTPSGIHRTFIDSAGGKLGRKMLGRTKHAVIKLDADETVTSGLTIGEGVETCLAARLAGFRPVWALGSVGTIAAFPVLAGIEAITILAENDGASTRAVKECASRWHAGGREVFAVKPLVGKDLNDAWAAP
jgi:hypothetical protein